MASTTLSAPAGFGGQTFSVVDTIKAETDPAHAEINRPTVEIGAARSAGYGVAVTPDGTRLYYAGNPLSVVDTATNTLLTTVFAGFGPQVFGQFIRPAIAGEPTITWTTPPPSTITSEEAFTVAWSITGATTIDHINVHWDPVDPTSITTCSSIISCSTVSPTDSPAFLVAPAITEPTVLKYAVHARVGGVDHFSDIVTVTVNPSRNRRPPNPPATMAQLKSAGATSLGIGQIINESTVILKAIISDPDGDSVKLQIELHRLDEFAGAFTGEPTHESERVASGSQARIVAFGLVNGDYHWRARTIDATGAMSDWVGFGGNSDSAADFIIDIPTTGPDLAVEEQTIHAYSAQNSILEAGEDAVIEFRVKNVGRQPSQAGIFLIGVRVWDKNEPDNLNTPEARKLGRAVIQLDGFHVLIPALPPDGTHMIHLPEDALETPKPRAYIVVIAQPGSKREPMGESAFWMA